MKVNHALILAAGAGTRMGEIGKVLPKVLWPVFEKRLLELEVEYAKRLGAEKIYINVHHYSEKLLSFIQGNPSFAEVEILVEKDPIDIGGAVHNLANVVGYHGNLLIINSDQFIFLKPDVWDLAWEKYRSADVLLFAYDVNSTEHYNGLELREDCFQKVIPNASIPRGETHATYTGMSLVKLDKLKPRPGESRFFDSVANPKDRVVKVENIKDSPYWDFGTLERYWCSCFEVLKDFERGGVDMFTRFLIECGALKPERVSSSAYACEGEKVINLSSLSVKGVRNKIIFGEIPDSKALAQDERAIILGNLVEKL